MARIKEEDFDCLLSDLRISQQNIEFLQVVTNYEPTLRFILFAENESDKVINNTIKAGATDYIPKPIAKTSEETFLKRLGTPHQTGRRDSNRIR
ncbi:hypothetical protein EL22_28555 [Halostagnicola sp. A56]|uniref:response regulator n=1 Tax=Halostagnicola sp. A56 TaxID=1495067 RepID=UPI00065F6B16|nr:response regulator [Halostagnicola sp. A56]KMT45691.1 hypothetical protein EL22_28555 [Halostagnicola sp. A56]